MQIMALARYARLGAPGEMLGWDEQPVSTVRRWFARLNQLLEMESASRQATEA